MSTPKRPSYMDRIGYQTGLLGGMACLAGAALVLGDLDTKEDIKLRKAEDMQASLQQVIPPALYDNNLLENPLQIDNNGTPVVVYRATKEQRAVAFAYEVVKPGYSGDITMMMGINSAGEIIGVRVVSHTETPGLGDKMESAKDDWVFSFDGRYLGNPPTEQWKVKKDGGHFDQWTGATITPRAIVAAIKEGLEMFQQNQHVLLEIKPETDSSDKGPFNE